MNQASFSPKSAKLVFAQGNRIRMFVSNVLGMFIFPTFQLRTPLRRDAGVPRDGTIGGKKSLGV